ncbi:hypothetical protein E2562_003146 [Oryza meyeriana var. granulata]|uniref:Uncharacterized protein n=1 Tax=Oryza meyeriana var. granulata TaxID=110450 RepID=A0A6G1EBP3_9ORYZ|nr:hypothetical protein E2562_003146 [Oryza meyeriana var. granulata]
MEGIEGWRSQCCRQGMEGPAAKGRMSQSHHKNGSTKPKPFPRTAKKRACRNGRRTTARGNKCPTA